MIFGVPKLTPWTFPFILSPGISQKNQSLSIDFHSLHDRVSMTFNDAFSRAVASEVCPATKEEFLVNFQKLLFPEIVFVKDVRDKKLSGHTSSQIFHTFTSEASFNN